MAGGGNIRRCQCHILPLLRLRGRGGDDDGGALLRVPRARGVRARVLRAPRARDARVRARGGVRPHPPIHRDAHRTDSQ